MSEAQGKFPQHVWVYYDDVNNRITAFDQHMLIGDKEYLSKEEAEAIVKEAEDKAREKFTRILEHLPEDVIDKLLIAEGLDPDEVVRKADDAIAKALARAQKESK